MVWPKIVLLSAFLFFFKEKGNMSKTIVIQNICSVHKMSPPLGSEQEGALEKENPQLSFFQMIHSNM
jgi:hypothetical protein